MDIKKVGIGVAVVVVAGGGFFALNQASNNDSGSSSKTISFWYGGDGDTDIKPIIKEFTKETGINVKIQSVPWSQYNDKLLTAAASKSGPDLMVMGTTSVPNFVSSKSLMDISDIIKKDKNLQPNNFFKGNVATTKVNGRYYGVPWYTETRVLYYRKDLLKTVGYNEAPKNWNELYDAAYKLSQRSGKDTYGFSIDQSEPTFGFMMARQNGATLLSKDGKTEFNQKPMVETLDYLKKFVKNGVSPKEDLKLSIGESFGNKGLLPMFVSGPWMVKSIEKDSGLKDSQWGVAQLPSGKDNNMSNTGGGDLAVFKYTSHKTEAVKLMKFLSKRENQIKYYKNSNSLPARKDAWNDKSLQNSKVQVIKNQLSSSQPMPLIKQWDQIGQNYIKAWEKISVENADTQKTLDTFNDQTNKSINKSK
ncbi:extracellular solute-binding protein [Leuconostoc pseudomesenteroides]|uniref:extracellular solute-binding protein n=1 Tax=Leuconostoc pseudomesenteroides TaxID=33968 RepID=UPI0039ED8FF7